MEEEWRPVVGYEGLYEVSNLGRVVSLHYRHSNRRVELKPFNQIGYLRAQLNKNGLRRKFLVHTLVATAFIPNPLHRTEIDHINGDRGDNRVSNLRWCTRSENLMNPATNWKMSRYGVDNKFYGKHHSDRTKKMLADSRRKPVFQFTMSGEFIREWPSTISIERELGIRNTLISRCCRPGTHRYSTNGFIWRYNRYENQCP